MKRLLCVLLVFALLAAPALADEPLSLIPAVNDYAGANYADVASGSWYESAARVCYETGLMLGTQNGFEPARTLSVAEAAAIAARLREGLTGEAIPSATPLAGQTRLWYQDDVDYLSQAAQASGADLYDVIPWTDAAALAAPATRYDFLILLDLAVAQNRDSMTAINAITSLPDTSDSAVLSFYNAGVLTGKDAYGTFDPQGTLSRAECAAMAARVVRPQLRQSFVPAALPQDTGASSGAAPTLSYEEDLLRTEALRVNGQSIPFSTYLETLNALIFRTDFGMAANGGKRLDWDAKYDGVDDLAEYFKSLALDQVLQDHLVSSRAAALGCAVEDLPAALFPDPSALLGRVYRAKHILVADQATAQALLSQLMAAPSLELFDQLMDAYNTDPGMSSNPNGYLFTDGDMVTEFETAVKALDLGSCSSAPVQSQFGWHIILRLDPRTYPDWEKSVRSMFYEKTVESWMNSSTVTPNTVELSKLDVRGRYEAYLVQMGM